jgi:hypothetical protein
LEKPMPLTPGKLLGYDAKRMVFVFTMMHGPRIVDCEISSAALDDLADEKGTRPGERHAQFLRLREVIEHVTSEAFVLMDMPQDETVRIFTKHLKAVKPAF